MPLDEKLDDSKVDTLDTARYDAAVLYQVLGVLLDDTGQFETEKGQAALDLAAYLAGSYDERPQSVDSLLPWHSLEEENK